MTTKRHRSAIVPRAVFAAVIALSSVPACAERPEPHGRAAELRLAGPPHGAPRTDRDVTPAALPPPPPAAQLVPLAAAGAAAVIDAGAPQAKRRVRRVVRRPPPFAVAYNGVAYFGVLAQ